MSVSTTISTISKSPIRPTTTTIPTINIMSLHQNICNAVTSHGTNYEQWNRLLGIVRDTINSTSIIEEKIDLLGLVVYTLRQEFIEGRKRLGRRHHLDPLIDVLHLECSLKLSQIEQGIFDYEDDDQYNLAPNTYSLFTGMLFQKILGIPNTERRKEQIAQQKQQQSPSLQNAPRYAGAKFQTSPSPSNIPLPPQDFFKVKQTQKV